MASLTRVLPLLQAPQIAACRVVLPRVCAAGFHETPASWAAGKGKQESQAHLDYYKILGVKPSASHDDIKEAFRQLGAQPPVES